jgi:hypothetical protein
MKDTKLRIDSDCSTKKCTICSEKKFHQIYQKKLHIHTAMQNKGINNHLKLYASKW